MTRRDLTHQALRHEETDRLPYYLSLLPPTERLLREHLRVEDVYDAIGCYVRQESVRPPVLRTVQGDIWRDEWGVVWRNTEVDRGYLLEGPLKEPSLQGFRLPDPRDPRKYAHLDDSRAAHRDLFMVCWVGDLFERAHFLRGYEQLLMDFVEHPQFAHGLLNAIADHNVAVVEELSRFDMDALFVSDDYATQRGLMMSRAMWEDFIAPPLARIHRAIKELGRLTFHHSDGNIADLVPALIALGVDLIHPVQPECMEVFDLKATYGQRLAFWGGLSTQRTLPFGSPAEVRHEACNVASRMRVGGGYILDTGINLQRDVPLSNLLALIEALQETGWG